MDKRKKHIETLRKYYSIEGDGVATLRVNRLVEDDKFQETLTKLSEIKLKKDNISDTSK